MLLDNNIRDRHTGVYVGMAGIGALPSGMVGGPQTGTSSSISTYSGTSSMLSVASGRISFMQGLTGPCLSTDTACSSTLVAVHLAVSALKLSECSRALPIGVGFLEPAAFIAFSAAGMLSLRGRCHTFDSRADGYCRGESVNAFLLDSSTVSGDGLSTVLGTRVQQDGPSASLTAPNGSSQQRLIETVRAGKIPSLEAHGTGTALGDPIEVCTCYLFVLVVYIFS